MANKIYRRFFLGTDGYRSTPSRPTFILVEIKSTYTGGPGASSIVAFPFLAHQLMYL